VIFRVLSSEFFFSNICVGTRHHVVVRMEPPAHDFFDKNFVSTSTNSISASYGVIDKERGGKAKFSPTAKRANDSSTQKPKMKRQLSGGKDKQRLIEEEITRWTGVGGSGGKGEGEGDVDKQAEIARQVAMWAAVDDKKKSPKPAKVVRYSSEQHAAAAAAVAKRDKKPDVKGDTVSLIYRNRAIGAGKYGLALWKTNSKVHTVSARIIVKNLEDGDVILSRIVDMGRADLVSKTTFAISPSEAPASAELIVSHSRCSSDSPISVTLQLLNPGGVPPVDIPLPLEHHERERVTIVESKRQSCVKLWRSLLINVVGARDLPPHMSNLYVTVHVGANYDRTTTLWNFTKVGYRFSNDVGRWVENVCA
jgi:hypothetical protein